MTNVICGLTAKKPGSVLCPTLVLEYMTTYFNVQMTKLRLLAFTTEITTIDVEPLQSSPWWQRAELWWKEADVREPISSTCVQTGTWCWYSYNTPSRHIMWTSLACQLSYRSHALAYAGPAIWNSLPFNLTDSIPPLSRPSNADWSFLLLAHSARLRFVTKYALCTSTPMIT